MNRSEVEAEQMHTTYADSRRVLIKRFIALPNLRAALSPVDSHVYAGLLAKADPLRHRKQGRPALKSRFFVVDGRGA
jgi:hypothetical protein